MQPDLGSARPGWDGDDLMALLVSEPDDAGVLTSQHAAANSNGAIFGGQLIGQALMTAAHGLSPKLAAHSLQLSFLAPGLTDKPLQFDVRRLLLKSAYRATGSVNRATTPGLRWLLHSHLEGIADATCAMSCQQTYG